jgi:hypothetical protein
MGISEVTPHKLVPSVGSLGALNMDSMNPSSNNNSTTSGCQVRFYLINFLPHPPALHPASGNFGQGLDLAIGSLDFRISTQDGKIVCLSRSSLTTTATKQAC